MAQLGPSVYKKHEIATYYPQKINLKHVVQKKPKGQLRWWQELMFTMQMYFLIACPPISNSVTDVKLIPRKYNASQHIFWAWDSA